MKRLLAIGLMCVALTGCQNLANMLEANPTVVNVVDAVRAGCGIVANSSDVQALISSGIPGLSTISAFEGAICAAFYALPVSAVQGGMTTVAVAGVTIHAQRAVK